MAVSKDCLLKAVKLLGETIDTLNEMSKASKGSRDPLRVLLTRLRKVRSLLLAELDKPSFAGGNVIFILKKVATWLIEAAINNIQRTFSPQAFSRACRDELINGHRTCFEAISAHGRNQTEGPRQTPRYLFQLPVFG